MKEQTIFQEKSNLVRYKDIIKESDSFGTLSPKAIFAEEKGINITDNLFKDKINNDFEDFIPNYKFSIHKALNSMFNSMKYALEGLKYILKTEINIRIHLLAGFAVILAACYLKVTSIEMIILLFSIISVIVTEIINTALEISLDIVNGTKFNYGVKIAKDIIASAVLLTAINAAIVGIIIFGKYII